MDTEANTGLPLRVMDGSIVVAEKVVSLETVNLLRSRKGRANAEAAASAPVAAEGMRREAAGSNAEQLGSSAPVSEGAKGDAGGSTKVRQAAAQIIGRLLSCALLPSTWYHAASNDPTPRACLNGQPRVQ